MNTELRMLTIKQPFALLMLSGKLETRTWNTEYRGPVLFHAAKRPFPMKELHAMCTHDQLLHFNKHMRENDFTDLYGKAFATGNLVNVRPMKRPDEALCYVQYSPVLFVFEFTEVMPIKRFDVKGRQGFQRVNESIIEKISYE